MVVTRRSNKMLLPPAQATFDFLSSDGSNYLPDMLEPGER